MHANGSRALLGAKPGDEKNEERLVRTNMTPGEMGASAAAERGDYQAIVL